MVVKLSLTTPGNKDAKDLLPPKLLEKAMRESRRDAMRKAQTVARKVYRAETKLKSKPANRRVRTFTRDRKTLRLWLGARDDLVNLSQFTDVRIRRGKVSVSGRTIPGAFVVNGRVVTRQNGRVRPLRRKVVSTGARKAYNASVKAIPDLYDSAFRTRVARLVRSL